MARRAKRRIAARRAAVADPFKRRPDREIIEAAKPLVHMIRKGVRCDTDKRGFEKPRDRSPLEIVIDASEGFVPLWAKNTILRWRFQERSFRSFQNPDAAKTAIQELFGEAVLKWGAAAPVKFAKRSDLWDFEIVMKAKDDCDASGCVLASAFFPDPGRHELIIYPEMFDQTKKEQVDTLVHEIGHIFGLRHFFAQISETEWASEIFGRHRKFSIMNYGTESVLTKYDRDDLKRLYRLAWSGELGEINGTEIKFVKPYHTAGDAPESVVAVGQMQAIVRPPRRGRRPR